MSPISTWMSLMHLKCNLLKTEIIISLLNLLLLLYLLPHLVETLFAELPMLENWHIAVTAQ